VDTAVTYIHAQWAKQQQQQQQQQQTSQQQQQQQFQPNLALVFASCNYGAQLQDVVAAVRRSCPTVKHIFGCSVSENELRASC
jgi:transcription initiation factor TFIID subunit TAF12